MKNKILSTIIISLVFLLQSVTAQNNLYNEVERVKKSNISFEKIHPFQLTGQSLNSKLVEKFNNKNEVVFLKYNSTEFKDDAKAINLEIPLSSRKNFNLELVKLENCYNYKITTDKGKSYKPNKLIKHYRGIVSGIPNSLATFTFFENKVMGIISTDEGNFNFVFDKKTQNHLLYNDKNLIKKSSFECSTISDDNFIPYSSDVLFATKETKMCEIIL